MNFNIENKNVFVSASSKGIGRATAELFLKEDCNVTISSSNIDNLEKTTSILKEKYSDRIHYVKCDINKSDEIKAAIESAQRHFGTIEILVNNCGGPLPGYLDDITEENWLEAYNQVLMSAVRFTKLLLPHMKQNNWGRIINITSIAVKQPVDNLLLSNTFRSALTSFTKTLSNQIGMFNITMNNVAPGLTKTERIEQLIEIEAKKLGTTKEEVFFNLTENIPLKRYGKAEEIAAAVVFLASEPGSYINGQTIVVDGGFIKSSN